MGKKTNTSFQEGEGGRPKGAKNKLTLAKEVLNNNLWDKIGEKITGEGIDKCWRELNTLDGKDYVYSFLALMEYFKPKLSRTTLEGGDKAIEVKQLFKIGDKEFEL